MAIHTVKPYNIATFLGRKLNTQYERRWAAVQHPYRKHAGRRWAVSLKLYGKFGVLRRIGGHGHRHCGGGWGADFQKIACNLANPRTDRKASPIYPTRWLHFIGMDLRMPVMDGDEATRQLGATEGGREVKIAAVTAPVQKRARAGPGGGTDDFVRRPWRKRIFDYLSIASHISWEYDILTRSEWRPGRRR